MLEKLMSYKAQVLMILSTVSLALIEALVVIMYIITGIETYAIICLVIVCILVVGGLSIDIIENYYLDKQVEKELSEYQEKQEKK